jgi:hypothetical protein
VVVKKSGHKTPAFVKKSRLKYYVFAKKSRHKCCFDVFSLFYNQSHLKFQQVGGELEDHPIFQIPWFHHVQIFTKCKSVKEALFYVKKTVENGWSRAVLVNFIEADLFSAQGKSQNNFSRVLPEPQSDLANQNSLEATGQPIGVSEYEVSKFLPDNLKSSLPSVEELEEELRKV